MMIYKLKEGAVFLSGKHIDYDVWELYLETNQLRQHTAGNYFNDSSSLSPDGSRMTFISNRHRFLDYG